MNIDDILKLLNEVSSTLPNSVDSELKADINSLAQKMKSKIEENKTATLEGKNLVHTVENTKAEMDFLTSQFKEKYGTKSNK